MIKELLKKLTPSNADVLENIASARFCMYLQFVKAASQCVTLSVYRPYFFHVFSLVLWLVTLVKKGTSVTNSMKRVINLLGKSFRLLTLSFNSCVLFYLFIEICSLWSPSLYLMR
jgi:hypothetical protein